MTASRKIGHDAGVINLSNNHYYYFFLFSKIFFVKISFFLSKYWQSYNPGVQYNRRNKPEKRRGSYRIWMVAKHVLSAGNGRRKDPAARSLPDQQFLSLSRSMNSKEATRSNSKLVGPSDYQVGDDGVELELISIQTMNRIRNYLALKLQLLMND